MGEFLPAPANRVVFGIEFDEPSVAVIVTSRHKCWHLTEQEVYSHINGDKNEQDGNAERPGKFLAFVLQPLLDGARDPGVRHILFEAERAGKSSARAR